MENLTFNISISASADKVWTTLWNDESYREWTRVFSEGSYAVSDWKEGSKVLFLNQEGSGMYSVIAKSQENKLMSFKHLGMVKDGNEQPIDNETKAWSGATENYFLDENNGITSLTITVEIIADHLEYFNNTFPKAIQKIKEISERKN